MSMYNHEGDASFDKRDERCKVQETREKKSEYSKEMLREALSKKQKLKKRAIFEKKV